MTLQQPQLGVRSRFVTKVRLGFSDGSSVSAHLGSKSLGFGQKIAFTARRSSSLTVTIAGMTGSQTDFSGQSGVGFAEVRIPGVGP